MSWEELLMSMQEAAAVNGDIFEDLQEPEPDPQPQEDPFVTSFRNSANRFFAENADLIHVAFFNGAETPEVEVATAYLQDVATIHMLELARQRHPLMESFAEKLKQQMQACKDTGFSFNGWTYMSLYEAGMKLAPVMINSHHDRRFTTTQDRQAHYANEIFAIAKVPLPDQG